MTTSPAAPPVPASTTTSVLGPCECDWHFVVEDAHALASSTMLKLSDSTAAVDVPLEAPASGEAVEPGAIHDGDRDGVPARVVDRVPDGGRVLLRGLRLLREHDPAIPG